MLKVDVANSGIPKRQLDAFLRKNSKTLASLFKNRRQEGYAFLELPGDQSLLKKIGAFTKIQSKNKWENIVVLGIGGSALGTIAVQEALLGTFHNLTKKPRLLVVDNIDPNYTGKLFETINLKKSLFVVISKSGTTTEPMVLYAITKEKLLKANLPVAKHLVFITDPKEGLLRPIAKKEGITTFDVPPKVGGRFSVLSAVGLVPLALAGVNIRGLMKGAKAMQELIKKTKPEENPALKLAALQYLLDRKRGKSMTVLMPYASGLFRVGDWYRQLLAESIGKNKKTGPTPINALGTTDQHSQLQLYAEGPNNKWIIFMTIEKWATDPKTPNVLPKEIGFLNGKKMSDVLQAAYHGTAEALRQAGRPNATITLKKLDAETLGGVLTLLMCQVALLGDLYKVNAFDQPGVEASKKITKKLLSEK